MQLKLLAADVLDIDRAALPAEFQQATGRALRRTGGLAALALLACLRCKQRETWARENARSELPTVLLWHTRSVIAEEASRLLSMMLQAREAIMPFDFLASQPALVGVTLHPHFPELSQAICLPWVDETGGDIWPRSLQLAAHWLHDQACQRVICVQLGRAPDRLQAHALSLSMGERGPQAIATLQIGTTGATRGPAPARDFVPRLSNWLQASGQAPLHLDGTDISVRASLELPL